MMKTLIKKIEAELSEKAKERIEVVCVLNIKNYTKLKKYLLENNTNMLKTIPVFDLYVNRHDVITNAVEKNKLKCVFGSDLDKVCNTSEFLNELNGLIEEKNAIRKKNRTVNTVSNMFLSEVNSEIQIVKKSTSLELPHELRSETDADRQLYAWFARDIKNNLFFRDTKRNCMVRVNFCENSSRTICPDPELWNAIFSSRDAEIKNWLKEISDISWDFFEKSENITNTNTLLEKIHEVVPACVMSVLSIAVIAELVQDPDNPKNVQKIIKNICAEVTSAANSSLSNVASTNRLKDALRKAFAEIQADKLELMKDFSNNYGYALYTLPIDVYKNMEDKSLPGTWKMFLESKFKTQKVSQFYRLASFINSVVDASNFSRQALCIVGEGNDGKSVLVETLREGLNKLANNMSFVGVCNAGGFRADNTQNGLINCLDARLITIPDVDNCTDVINESIFKAITGLDTFTCNKKYAAPIEKKFAGTKIIMTTNNSVYLKNTFATSRIIPLYCTPRDPGEKDMNIMQLKNSLLEEFPQFLAWCIDFTKKVNAKIGNVDSNVTPIRDIEHMDKPEKEVFEELMSKSKKFYYMTADEYAAETEDYFEEIFNEIFQEDCNGKILKRDFNAALRLWAEMNKDRNYNFADRSKDLREFVKFVASKHNSIVKFCSTMSTNMMTNIKIKKDQYRLPEL